MSGFPYRTVRSYDYNEVSVPDLTTEASWVTLTSAAGFEKVAQHVIVKHLTSGGGEVGIAFKVNGVIGPAIPLNDEGEIWSSDFMLEHVQDVIVTNASGDAVLIGVGESPSC